MKEKEQASRRAPIPDRLYDSADPSGPGGDKFSDGYVAAYQTRKIMENQDLKWYHKASFMFYMYGPTALSTVGAGIVAKQSIQNFRTPYQSNTPFKYRTESSGADKNELKLREYFYPKSISYLKTPQGVTTEQFQKISEILLSRLQPVSKNIVIQGSRAAGTAKPTSDLDIAVLVPEAQFNDLVIKLFNNPNPGSAKERTMQRAIESGKIQSGEAKLSSLRQEIQQELGIDVDISIIKINGKFDNGVQMPIKN